MLRSIAEGLQATATIKTIYGDPLESAVRTVIPVARVRYGFGGGGGTKGADVELEDDEGAVAVGGGGGGGVDATPGGLIEITEEGTRYVSFDDRRRLVRASILGLVLVALLLRRRHKG